MDADPEVPGAFHVIVIVWSPGVALTCCGGPGGRMGCGVTAFDGPDVADKPAAVVPCTVNVYEVPLVRPGTVTVPTPAGARTVEPLGVAVTVYDAIGEPPVDVGKAHVTVAAPSPGTPCTEVGGAGAVYGDAEVPSL